MYMTHCDTDCKEWKTFFFWEGGGRGGARGVRGGGGGGEMAMRRQRADKEKRKVEQMIGTRYSNLKQILIAPVAG